MYFVYWEYVGRAKAFAAKRGDVYFAQGSEAIAVLRMLKKHGAVPLSAYPGKPATQNFHDHESMFKEMNDFLMGIRENNTWDEQFVTSNIRSILDHYLGAPPASFIFHGKEYTPGSFADEMLKINPDDYYSFMSTMSSRYGDKAELVEPDNWWHEDSYFNIKIDEFLQTIIDAVTAEQTVCICGDVSEPGFDKYLEIGIIPEFDIPQEYINADSRELRLYNKNTTDDHCIHIVGYTEQGEHTWFMIKDSGSGAFDGPNEGYRFIRDDYVRLKMMNIMVHKDGAAILDKLIK